MNIFEMVKERLNLIDTAEHYGISVRRNGFTNCIFHNDRHPSMKLYKDHYHCFACGAHGDVISFTARLFGLSQYKAAKRLAADFGISYVKPRKPIVNEITMLTEYISILESNRDKYRPCSPDEELHPLYVDSIQELSKYQLKFIDNKFITADGNLSAEKVSALVGNMLIPHVYTNLARRVKSLTDALKLYCHADRLITCPDEIHVLNGILKTSGRFIPEKRLCMNRLKVRYTPNQAEPDVFLKFLDDMLEDEDIITLQEYLGYCLIPSTRGQAMLFIIGNGGEGKSRIGVVMKSIFGDSMIESKLHRLEADRFARANLQGKLLMIDDDMQLEALTSTGYIKNLITAETPVDIEIKGQQSFQAELYARFLCFGNGSPKALYDRTDGFSRRLIILTTKPIPKSRVVDRYIADKMIAEKDRIFGWMFAGLQRLIQNNYCFTISEKSKQNIADMVSDNCNAIEFLRDDSAIVFGNEYQTSCTDIYEAYCSWCNANALSILKRETFVNWLKSNQGKYNIKYTCNIPSSNGRRVRGFRGIYVKYIPNIIERV